MRRPKKDRRHPSPINNDTTVLYQVPGMVPGGTTGMVPAGTIPGTVL